MIGLVTDSASMITDEMRARCAVTVVPVTIVIDDVPHREGIELDARTFYDHLERGASVSTAAPSPGEIVAGYERVAARGATTILSVHTGSDYSGIVNAATIAARAAPVPVRVVDTATASFAVAFAVRAAAETIAAGAELDAAARRAEVTAGACGNVFVVGAADLARSGGRFASTPTVSEASVLGDDGTGLREVGRADGTARALDAMCDFVGVQSERRGPLCVAVGDAACAELGAALAARVADLGGVTEVLRYRVGPSVAAHTGVGTVGAVFVPTDDA